MKFALFLGCTIPARSRQYEMSARKVAEKLGLVFEDVPGFGCCGFPLKSVDPEKTALLAAWSLSLAEEKGLPVMTLCSACSSNLAEENHRLKHDEKLRRRINEKLARVGKEFRGTTEVKHILRVIHQDLGLAKISETVKNPLTGLKVASHYGCHYLKPSELYDKFDDPENPRSLDQIVAAIGGTPVSYDRLKQCCGGAVLVSDEATALGLTKDKLDAVKASGAEAMTLVCPFCNVMYDNNQKSIETRFAIEYGLPVFYMTQLMGLAMGISSKDLGMNLNSVKTKELIARFAGEDEDDEKKEKKKVKKEKPGPPLQPVVE
ncbi:MAG: CoB--CoM heterodisulfide reductase iron-sulfur subunit B family protein [Deltaproteobacteria bacterium]|nr:CoB--CoM heterodisulfide reductase iron-sulfur subunit B family protein [Deltaproteobacteria bacterium]